MRDALARNLPLVRRQVAPDRPFGVGLRLSAVAAAALAEPTAMDELKALLAASDCYVFTINGFPYGPFHGRRVKEAVYQPDWRHEERVAYSDRLADLLVELLPDDPELDGSVSTVPGTFKPLAKAPGAIDDIARNLIRHAAHLVGIRERTGRTIALALEPELVLSGDDRRDRALLRAAPVRRHCGTPAERAYRPGTRTMPKPRCGVTSGVLRRLPRRGRVRGSGGEPAGAGGGRDRCRSCS